MNIFITLCLVTLAVGVYCENCQQVGQCHETMCANEHGWWLHCTKGMCLCTHQSFVGKNCTDGQPATCQALHDSRCQDHGMVWHCVDSHCHCARV